MNRPETRKKRKTSEAFIAPELLEGFLPHAEPFLDPSLLDEKMALPFVRKQRQQLEEQSSSREEMIQDLKKPLLRRITGLILSAQQLRSQIEHETIAGPYLPSTDETIHDLMAQLLQIQKDTRLFDAVLKSGK